jgi:aminopeptidase N
MVAVVYVAVPRRIPRNIMRTLARTLARLTIVALPSGALDTYPRQPGVTVEHYVFALELSDASDEIRGDATVSIRFTKDGLTSFFLDLATPSNGKGMTTIGVVSDSVALRHAHTQNRLTITLARPSQAGELRRFTVRYQGIPADGLRMGVNKYNERGFFSWNWPDKAREWLPMIDHPSAKATSEFIVTAPDKYAVVANGLRQSEVSLGDGRKRTHWKQNVPIASWLNAIGVAQFAVHHGGFVKGVELQTWVARQELDAGIARFEATSKRALEFFSERIGPYSYEKLANITAPFGGGATEHATVIFYGDGGTRSGAAPPQPQAAGGRGRGGAGAAATATAGRGAAGRGGGAPPGSGGVIAHEIAHQWFGNSVTESDWDDAWLSEGFATYFTVLYDEHHVGHDAFIRSVQSMFARARTAQQTEKPLVHENISDLRGVIPQLVYQKGGSVLHVLRGQVGTETFWRAIKEYYRRYQNGLATSKDLQRVFEETSGQELEWFFTQWLHWPTVPALEGSWSWDEAGKKVVIQLTQTQKGKPFRLPLEVGLVTEGTIVPRIDRIELTQASQRFEIAAERAPSDLVLDPNTWMLMEPPKISRRQP